MKANIQGVDVEGTPDEIVAFVHSLKRGGVVGNEEKTYFGTYVAEEQGMPKMTGAVKKNEKVKKNANKWKPWSTKDDAVIRENAHLGVKKLAKMLGRTRAAVNTRAYELRRQEGVQFARRSLAQSMAPANMQRKKKVFPKGIRRWTAEEVAKLEGARNLLQNKATRSETVRALAKDMNRTVKSVIVRANAEGISLWHNVKGIPHQ